MANDPAFPITILGVSGGLTKREYAAIQIMVAIAPADVPWKSLAAEAVRGADALLAELDRTKES